MVSIGKYSLFFSGIFLVSSSEGHFYLLNGFIVMTILFLQNAEIFVCPPAAPPGSLNSSFSLLYEAESRLKSIVTSKFTAAVHSGDVASVERFFKIFPLLGLIEEGLTKFGKYLAAQVSTFEFSLIIY